MDVARRLYEHEAVPDEGKRKPALDLEIDAFAEMELKTAEAGCCKPAAGLLEGFGERAAPSRAPERAAVEADARAGGERTRRDGDRAD